MSDGEPDHESADRVSQRTGGDGASASSKRSWSGRFVSVFWPLFRPHLGHFAGAFALLIVAAGFMIAGPLLVKRAIDVNIADKDVRGLYVTVAAYLAAQICYLITTYVMRNWLEWAGQGIMADLRKRLMNHLLALPASFHDRNSPGRLLSRVEGDTQALRMFFTTTGVMLVGDLILFLGMFIVMAMVSPRLTLVTGGFLPFLIGVTIYFQRLIHPLFVEVRSQAASISSRLTEFLQAMPTLRAFHRRHWALGDFQSLNRKKYETNLKAQTLIIVWFNLIELMEMFCFAVILGLGGYWTLQGLVTVGTLVMFVSYVRRFFEPLMRLSEQIAVIQKALAASERIVELLHAPLVVTDPAQPAALPGLRREVKFEDVWFRYDETGDWVLKGVSFALPVGQRWALVGPTGSGKTTIIALLLRLYDPQRGRIAIDGRDVREFSQQHWRERLALVQQDIYLFPESIEDNLRLGKEIDRAALQRVAKDTQVDGFLQQLPNGLQTNLHERGTNLSVGQRQLLSFTRALLRDPELLLLDEATSSVDPQTEHALTTTTKRALRGRTALIVAHRLSTIRDCDRILVLQDGEVVESGNHEQLLADGGLYSKMHHLQQTELTGAV